MRRTAFAALLAFAVAIPTTAGAAEGDPPALRIDTADHSAYPDVQLTVTLPADLAGSVLTGSDFVVVEDGEERAATATKLGADALQVVLVLDTSGSMRGEPLAAAQAAARDFIARMPSGVEVAVLGFGDTAEVKAPFTTDAAAATAAVDGLEARGETALYDALRAAADAFAGTEEARRWIVVLSDGGDTVSGSTLEEAIVAVLGASAGFYAVELPSPESDRDALQRLAASTEGTVVAADDPEALSGIFGSIATELISQYMLSYTSAAHGRTQVSVSATANGVTAESTRSVVLPPPPPTPPAAERPPVAPPPPPPPTTLAPPPPAPAEPFFVEPSPLTRPEALLAGGGFVFLALLLLLLALQGSRSSVVEALAKVRKMKDKRGALRSLAGKATLLAEKTLERTNRSKDLNTQLEQAGIRLRPAEFAVLAAAVGAGLLVVATVLGGPLLGIAAGGATVAVFRAWLGMRASKRKAAFADQLGDTLQMIAGSIRAGYGLLQAIESAASEALPPTSEEFSRLLVETQLGRDLGEALMALADRVESDDFRWVVEAIEIHRQVGGDLSEILDTVAATIRDRTRIRRRVRALSAEGRLSAIILIALPVLVSVAISITNPSYMAELTGTTIGRFMIGGGIGLILVGAAWMRRIVRPEF